jgi:hypothetical protein
MVYGMTETNLCPLRPEIWECSTHKGGAAALPHYGERRPFLSALHDGQYLAKKGMGYLNSVSV